MSLEALLGWTGAIYAFSWLYLLVLGRGAWGVPGRRRRLGPAARFATAYAVFALQAGVVVAVLVINSHRGGGAHQAGSVALYVPVALLGLGAVVGYLLARAAGLSNEPPAPRRPRRRVSLEDHPDLFEVLKRVDDKMSGKKAQDNASNSRSGNE